jgi:hypothetical protein
MYSDCGFSDLWKEVHGFRPSGDLMDEWNARTPRQKQELWNALCDELVENMKIEKLVEQECIDKFEARIADVISLGADDRQTALRWITGTEKFYHSQDVEHFVWEQGILFTDYGKKLIKELLDIVEYEEIEWA